MKKIFLSLSIFFTALNVNAKDQEFTIMHNSGGVSDIVSRFIVKELDTTYLPVNRPGAGGQIALRHLLDKETIMLATMIQVFVTNPINYKNLDHNPERDLEVLATIGIMPSALVCHTKTNIKTYADFQNYNKKITFAVGGYGSSEHIATEVLLSKNKNLDSVVVPYAQGGSASVRDLIGGHIDCMFANFPTIKNHLENKELTLIMTSHNLDPKALNWESIYKKPFPFQSYLSVIGPKKLEEQKKLKIKKDFDNLFKKQNINENLKDLGIFPSPSTNNENIKDSLKEMESVKNFILKNNIKTIEK